MNIVEYLYANKIVVPSMFVTGRLKLSSSSKLLPCNISATKLSIPMVNSQVVCLYGFELQLARGSLRGETQTSAPLRVVHRIVITRRRTRQLLLSIGVHYIS